MMERPDTVISFRVTVISVSNPSAILTNLAAARACNPFELTIVTRFRITGALTVRSDVPDIHPDQFDRKRRTHLR